MLKLTITNVDQSTADIITYIAKKSGGKVLNAKEDKLKEEDEHADFKEQMRQIKNEIVKKHNASSKHKISKVF
ncbi:MAG: hypothetical protein V4667_01030 [Bacteroidota bacterium]